MRLYLHKSSTAKQQETIVWKGARDVKEDYAGRSGGGFVISGN